MNSGQIFPHSNMETHKIVNVQFGLLNPKEIIRMAVCKIDQLTVTDKDGFPVNNGINDIRMGIVDKTIFCKTCGSNFTDCCGHFGYIELVKPVFHIGYLETIRKILRCVCFKCARILCHNEQKFKAYAKVKNAKKRQLLVFNLCKGKNKCTDKKTEDNQSETTSNNQSNLNAVNEMIHSGCGFVQPKYKKDKNDPMKIIAEFKRENNDDCKDPNQNLRPEDVLKIFEKISDDDIKALGFDSVKSRPEWMILTVLAVCPPQVRPSVSVDATLRSEDDLTFQYIQVLKANKHLKDQEENGAPHQVQDETRALLQFYTATLMNNEIPSVQSQQKSGRPIKAISSRLKGKEGRLRGNLMGKRVDFSARTVITPDPNLSLDQLGVPKSIALNLTFPEVVTPHNIDYLRKLVENGPTNWPGAKYIVRDDGVRIDLRYLKKRADIHLANGYIVERHMQDNDFVLFNRQPSLHKMSIMGHRVKILPYSTFRLNLSVTTPYNADFDGDEMNMHLPQSMETKAEISEIMHVPRQIVSPQANKPVMGIVQDSCIGVHMFTKRNVFLGLDDVMNLLMWLSDFNGELPVPAILKPKPLWTGKQIFSLILPKNINMNNFMSAYNDKDDNRFNPQDTIILIEKGELVQGTVCKKTVGNPSGGLVHLITNEYGCETTMNFFNNTQKITNNWLLLMGWTVGVSDIISDEQTSVKIRETMKETKESVNEILKKAQENKLECQPGKSMFEIFEQKVNEELNKARDTSGSYVLKNINKHNHLKNMVTAGSKGSTPNISQIIACVGQQNVEGKRIPLNFKRRTLPHFAKDDFGPESRGFVENSYLSGLTPQEFFFHAMGGREGLIDTAVKTSETGYIQRRLVKALEDVMVKYDGTVRNSNGAIIQFLYGEDGINPEFIEDQRIETLMMNNKDLSKAYEFLAVDSEYKKLKEFKVEIDEEFDVGSFIKNLRAQLIGSMEKDVLDDILYNDFHVLKLKLEEEYDQIVKDRDEMRNFTYKYELSNKGHFPVNIPRIKWNAKKLFNITNTSKSDLSPLYIIEKKEELKEDIRNSFSTSKDPIAIESKSCATKMFFIILNYFLSCKRMILVHKMSKKAFDWIIGEIKSRFIQAIQKPGEMVGSIAAQSIGEPATQMTLNTFHFAGVSSMNVTLGVPRLKEIINVAKKLKTPMMSIYLNDHERSDKIAAIDVKNQIELTMLKHVVINTKIIYDPDVSETIIEADQIFVSLHAKFHYAEDSDTSKMSPWVLRILLEGDALLNKNISIGTIVKKIESQFSNLEIIHSDENDDTISVIRIRLIYNPELKDISKEQAHSQECIKQLESRLMKDLHLCGIPEIAKVYVQEAKIKSFDAETGAFQDKQTEWEILTDGTNLKDIFLVEKINFRRVTSNDIIQIYECLGIEAVRNTLIRELRKVLGHYGIYVNYRHLATLCDFMTQCGYLTSITRHGINKLEQGPMRKCSFEETVEVLLEAGLYSEIDYLKGISENIMLGQLAPYGTGSFDLLFDTDKIKNAEYLEDARLFEDVDMPNDMATPTIGYDSANSFTPTRTPFGMKTPNLGFNNTFTPMTAYRQSPIFTPSKKTPIYSLNQQETNEPVVNITSPYPYNKLQGMSPGYNPSEHAYSPIYDSDVGTKYRDSYSPRENLPMKSPAIGYKYNSPVTYSPSSPIIQTTKGMGSNYAYSPSYNINSSSNDINYSPTTPLARGTSPEYSKGNFYSVRSSSYSGAASPKLNYSPNSPTYNPKSPSYQVAYSSIFLI